jgi:hypothetical protein
MDGIGRLVGHDQVTNPELFNVSPSDKEHWE